MRALSQIRSSVVRPALFSAPVLAFLAAAATLPAFAIDTEVIGGAEWGWRTDFSPSFDPSVYNNHAIELGAVLKADEGVQATIVAETFSNVLDSNGNRQRTGLYDGEARNSDLLSRRPQVTLRTVQLGWNFIENGLIGLGTWHYSAAPVRNMRMWSEAKFNAAGIAEHSVAGLGAILADGKFYIGSPYDDVDGEFNTKDGAFTFFGTYAAPLIRKRSGNLTVTPYMEINMGGGRQRAWNMGTEASWSSTWKELSYALDGAVGYLDVRNKPVWTLLAEPSANWGSFSLGTGVYWAVLNGKDAATRSAELAQLDLPVELFTYVEPMITVHPKVGLSLPFTWNNPQFDDETDAFATTGFACTLWPTEGAELNSEVRYVSRPMLADNWQFAINAKLEF